MPMIMNAHEDIHPGDGLTTPVADALTKILQCIIPAMFRSQQPWALMGSLASVLQGMPDYTPPDIDLVATSQGAYEMEECLAGLGTTVRPVKLSSSRPYTSHFGIFDVDGVKVEVMGDLIIQCDDGSLHAEDHWSRWSQRVRVLHFRDMHIPVVPLEWQIVANALLRRPERVEGCAKQLLAAGYDRAYLDTVLSDQNYGERTIHIVREALHLDD
jgi:hypothetical protein